MELKHFNITYNITKLHPNPFFYNPWFLWLRTGDTTDCFEELRERKQFILYLLCIIISVSFYLLNYLHKIDLWEQTNLLKAFHLPLFWVWKCVLYKFECTFELFIVISEEWFCLLQYKWKPVSLYLLSIVHVSFG